MAQCLTANVDKRTHVGRVEPFQTETGGFNGISPNHAFAFGVEWAMFRAKLMANAPSPTALLPEKTTWFADGVKRGRRFSTSNHAPVFEGRFNWLHPRHLPNLIEPEK